MKSLPVSNPVSRWQAHDVAYEDGEAPISTYESMVDHARSIVSENDSPDVGFRFSVNPYRGCFHGCAYCYARPGHEYLSLGAGTDFERKILYKPNAPELLREAFEKKSWRGELVVFSGVTDCYQPLEKAKRLTRGCLEVCAEYRNPVAIITKSVLVERDIDVLREIAEHSSARVTVSIPFFDPEHARAMEPFVATPERRFATVEKLAAAGLRVGVSVAPIVPGLNERHVGTLLARAKDAGASYAFYVLLRLPGAVAKVFEERLRATLPLNAEKVIARVKEAHGGKMYDSAFGQRQHGDGPYATMVGRLFTEAARKHGLVNEEVGGVWVSKNGFSRPRDRSQLTLFDA